MIGPSRTLSFDRGALLRNVLMICISLEVMFFVLDYVINYSRAIDIFTIRTMFSTGREDSLAGWFSIIQTAMIAGTLWLIFVVVRSNASRWQRFGWGTLATFFTYLAIDDGAQVHENIGTAYHDYFSDSTGTLAAWTLDFFPSYRWQIVFMPVFAAMGVFMLFFLARELRGWKPKVAVFVALTCLATAVGIDFLEGLNEDHPLNPYTAIANNWELDYWTARTFGRNPYDTLVHFSKSIEETTEMFAMTLLWVTFLGHLTLLSSDLRLRFLDNPLAAEATPITAIETVEQAPATTKVATKAA